MFFDSQNLNAEFQIDTPTPYDAKALAALHMLAFAQGVEPAWSESEFKSCLCQPMTVARCVRQEKKIIACIMWSVAADSADLLTLVTHPHYRRRRCAIELLQLSEEILKLHKVVDLYLEVEMKNNVAINFYQKNNFISVGIRKAYFIKNEKRFDAITMKKNIQ